MSGNSVYQSLFTITIALMTLAALVLLLQSWRSRWLIAALVGQAMTVALQFVLAVAPQVVLFLAPLSMSLWALTALLFASGLLGYAIESRGVRRRAGE